MGGCLWFLVVVVVVVVVAVVANSTTIAVAVAIAIATDIAVTITTSNSRRNPPPVTMPHNLLLKDINKSEGKMLDHFLPHIQVWQSRQPID